METRLPCGETLEYYMNNYGNWVFVLPRTSVIHLPYSGSHAVLMDPKNISALREVLNNIDAPAKPEPTPEQLEPARFDISRPEAVVGWDGENCGPVLKHSQE